MSIWLYRNCDLKYTLHKKYDKKERERGEDRGFVQGEVKEVVGLERKPRGERPRKSQTISEKVKEKHVIISYDTRFMGHQ